MCVTNDQHEIGLGDTILTYQNYDGAHHYLYLNSIDDTQTLVFIDVRLEELKISISICGQVTRTFLFQLLLRRVRRTSQSRVSQHLTQLFPFDADMDAVRHDPHTA